MELKNFLKGNERVNVFDKGEKVYYKAMVVDLTANGFVISQPSARQGVLSLREREVWEFNIESGSALYFFSAAVLKRGKKGEAPVFLIEYPKTVRRQQRRQFYRLNINLDVEYIVVQEGFEKEEEKKEQDKNDILIEITEEDDMYKDIKLFDEKTVGQEYADGVFPAFTVDISGGGLQMVSEQYLKRDTELLLRIKIPPGTKDGISLKGRVIRSFAIHGGSSKKYRVAVTFIDVDEKIRDIVIEYIFDMSRKRAT